jgi:L-amino acid N-acyltransferase YncA
MDTIRFCTAAGDDDLEGILALQRSNLEANLTPAKVSAQGFVTVRHVLELLRDMNHAEAHVVAKAEERVIGYALVMTPSFRERIPILAPLFERLERTLCAGKPVAQRAYFVMGQVCVDKDFRGRGVFPGIFQHMRTLYNPRYDLVVTEVSLRNPRSMRAHEKVGFRELVRYTNARKEEWSLIAWDWKAPVTAHGG